MYTKLQITYNAHVLSFFKKKFISCHRININLFLLCVSLLTLLPRDAMNTTALMVLLRLFFCNFTNYGLGLYMILDLLPTLTSIASMKS